MTATASKLIWLSLVVIYFMLRMRPRFLSRKTPVRHSARDPREIVLMALALTGLVIVPAVYVAIGFLRFADYRFLPAQGYLGAAVFLAALWLFYRTHRDLGHNWSVSLDLRERHTLVKTGIYAYVRHPMYSAFWLMAIAQLLMLPNWIAGPAGLVAFGTLFFGRVRREEEMMISAFGEQYRAYMRQTARVLPWFY